MRIGRQREDDDGKSTHRRTLARAALVLCVGASCAEPIEDIDRVFYDGDGRTVHCAISVDDAAGNEMPALEAAMDRARDRGETLELYGHRPGENFSLEKLDAILKAANARGLAYVLYSDFAKGTGTGPGLALSLDDNSIALWADALPTMRDNGAKLTFFVSRYARLRDDERATLRTFLDDGHELQSHTVTHARLPQYVEERGLQATMDEEIIPSIVRMREDGYPIEAFAYPYGARTDELDRAILEHVDIVRSLSFKWGFPVRDACP